MRTACPTFASLANRRPLPATYACAPSWRPPQLWQPTSFADRSSHGRTCARSSLRSPQPCCSPFPLSTASRHLSSIEHQQPLQHQLVTPSRCSHKPAMSRHLRCYSSSLPAPACSVSLRSQASPILLRLRVYFALFRHSLYCALLHRSSTALLCRRRKALERLRSPSAPPCSVLSTPSRLNAQTCRSAPPCRASTPYPSSRLRHRRCRLRLARLDLYIFSLDALGASFDKLRLRDSTLLCSSLVSTYISDTPSCFDLPFLDVHFVLLEHIASSPFDRLSVLLLSLRPPSLSDLVHLHLLPPTSLGRLLFHPAPLPSLSPTEPPALPAASTPTAFSSLSLLLSRLLAVCDPTSCRHAGHS